MELLIITGLSGGGKSRAMDILEDFEYYCVDNMPVALLPKLVELTMASRGKYERVALVTDSRGLEDAQLLFETLDTLRLAGLMCRILFLEADRQTIIRRYKETRRPHPLQVEGESMDQAIDREIVRLMPLKDVADFIIDTSNLTTAALRSRIGDLVWDDRERRKMGIQLTAFGFKHGLPMDADLVFDLRFLPNPFYVQELKEGTGQDKAVRDFVFSFEDAQTMLSKLCDFMDFLIPLYGEEGKYMLNVAIGCTGGKHRSVATVCALAEYLNEKGHGVSTIFRDMEK